MIQSTLQKQPKSLWRQKMGYSSIGRGLTLSQLNRTLCLVTLDKTKGRKKHKQAATEDGTAKSQQSILRKEMQDLVMSMGSRSLAVIDCKEFSSKY